MKPFSEDDPGPCPKCYSYEGWTVQYQSADEYIDEFLRVICRNCGYWFAMWTADAKVPA